MVKSKKIKATYFWAGILLAQFVLFFVFSKINFFISLENSFFEFQKTFHQKLFSAIPFSFGDLLYLFSGVYLMYLLYKKSLGKLFIFINAFYFLYQIFWGMLYFQKPILAQFSDEKPTLEDAKLLAIKYLEICKKDRDSVNEDRNGVFKIYDLRKLKSDILKGQQILPKEFSEKKTTYIASIKPSLFKGMMSYTGISGYYNPFTSEAQYNNKLPSSEIGFTLAHETSHQLGFAREQEASFIGFIISKNSRNKGLKYSSDLYALKSLLRAIENKDSLFVKKVVSNYSDGMKRDWLYEKSFTKKHEGIVSDFFYYTNNIFLKTNQQDGNITYSYFVKLLIKYEGKN